jgi:hypothetical protein
MKVRRPECDEQPSRPIARNVRANHSTMLAARMRPPRSEVTMGPEGTIIARQTLSACRSSGCSGMRRPDHFAAGVRR